MEEYSKDNLINRQFTQEIIDRIWVMDIAYTIAHCSNGRWYVSTYIDLATRILRCFKISTSMKKEVILNPLRNYQNHLPEITHSDRGSQYTSSFFQDLLVSRSIPHSMSKPGTPVDNAVIESFHRSIKRELIYPSRLKTKGEMKALIQNCVNTYYFYDRIHTKFHRINIINN
jgi:putative transposase